MEIARIQGNPKWGKQKVCCIIASLLGMQKLFFVKLQHKIFCMGMLIYCSDILAVTECALAETIGVT